MKYMRKITFVCFCPSVDCETIDKEQTEIDVNIKTVSQSTAQHPPPPPPLPPIVPPKVQVITKETTSETKVESKIKPEIKAELEPDTIFETIELSEKEEDKKGPSSFISEILEKRNSIIKNNV